MSCELNYIAPNKLVSSFFMGYELILPAPNLTITKSNRNYFGKRKVIVLLKPIYMNQ